MNNFGRQRFNVEAQVSELFIKRGQSGLRHYSHSLAFWQLSAYTRMSADPI